MGKGNGAWDRPGISLEASDSTKTELNVSENVTSISEINTTLKLQQIGQQWWTKDVRVTFGKTKEGWIVDAYSDPIRKTFEEYGLIHQIVGTSSYEHTCFPSLREVRQAVNDVSLEASLNINSGLTKQKFISYKIGDLPLRIRREKGHWRVFVRPSVLPQSLKNHFNSTQGLHDFWMSTDSASAHYPTRKAAHQAVINWLAQTITKKQRSQ